MGDIVTTISVDVSGAGELDDLAAAADKAAAALDKLQESAGKGFDTGAAGAGADKLAASYEAAFAKIQAGMDKLNAQMADMGKAGGGSDAAAASLAKIEDAEKGVAEQADAMTASVGKADDTLKGLGGTADVSAGSAGKLADGIKGVGDSAAETTAFMADLNKITRDNIVSQAEAQAAMTDYMKSTAAGNDLLVASKGSLATTSIEQDAAMRQSTLATKAASEDAAASAEATAGKYHMVALGGAAALAVGIDMAAKLQTSVTRLYTTAGESQKNLPLMSAGILALSGQTNTSQAQLGQGAYMVESAGFHGQSALNVLKAAAEGAQSEGAPLGDTANALTSLLNAYGMKGPGAPMSAMDQIIAMVSRGKMTMASAVSALPDVLPAASAAKLSFADVGGALSTMTSMGVSPDRAAQNLSHVITSIMNPNAVQTKEQQQLGLNPVQIENDLGKQGLTGTLGELSSTVMKQMGPAGDVLFKTFNQSQSAAKDANTMIAAMPSSIRSTAQAYADGTVSAAQWNQEMFKGSESAQQKNMLQQFATVENTAKGFNDLLKTGAPDVQTYAAAMDKLLGGQTGLNVAMELTGQHMPVMKANTDAIAAAARNAGDNVTGWSKVQGTLNFQLGSFTKSAEAVATEAGQVALPAVTGLLKGLGDVGGFLASNPDLAKALTIGGGALGAMAIAPKLASVGATALGSVGKVAETLNIPGLNKLAGIGSGTSAAGAATGLDAVATAGPGAAAALDAVAAAGGRAVTGETATGTGGILPSLGGGATKAEAAAVDAEVATADKSILGTIGGTLAKGIGPALLAGLITELGIKPIAEAHKIPGSGNTWWQGPKDLQTWGGVGNTINHALSQLSQMVTDPFDALFGTGKPKPPAPAGKDWTSVTGGSAPYPADTSLNIPASQFALHPQTALPGAESRYGGPPPTVVVNEPSIPMLGTGTHPGTVPAPQPVTTGVPMLGAGGHPSTVNVPTVNDSALVSAKGKIQADLNAINQALTASSLHPGKIPAPDISALESAKGKISGDLKEIDQALSQSTGKPVRIPGPDLSAVTAAAGKAGQAASAITAAMTTALGHAPIAAAPNLNAYKAAAGVAASDGSQISAGLAAGILAGEGQAVAAAHAVAAAVESALNVHLKITSPSKVTEKIGQDFTAGFSQGIIGGEDSAKAASAEIGSASVASLLQGLAGGSSNVQNAIQAVMGAASNPDAVTSIQQTIQTLIGDVPAKDTGLVKYLTAQQGKLSALANKQGALIAEITDAQQIATSAIGAAGITSAYGYEPALAASNGPTASQSILTGMQQQAQDTKAFAAELTQLKKEGLNATSLSQLAQAGTASGLPLAEGLAQGGKGAVSQLNQTEKQIIAASQQIGNVGGPAMYTSGQQVMTGLASGLKAELKQVDKVMTAEANAVIAKVQKTLGTKAATTSSTSSSSAAAGSTSAASAAAATVSAAGFSKASAAAGAAATGLDRAGTAGGMAATGLTSVATAAASAAAGLGKIVSVLAPLSVASAQPLGGGGYSAHPGGGVAQAQPITVHVHLDGQQLATSTTNVMIQNAASNWQSSPVPLPAGRR